MFPKSTVIHCFELGKSEYNDDVKIPSTMLVTVPVPGVEFTELFVNAIPTESYPRY